MMVSYLRLCNLIRRRCDSLDVLAPEGMELDAVASVVRCLKDKTRLNYGLIEVCKEKAVEATRALHTFGVRFWPSHVLPRSGAGPAHWRAVACGDNPALVGMLRAHALVTCAMPLDEAGERRRGAAACSLALDTATGACVVYVCGSFALRREHVARIRAAAMRFATRLCTAPSKPRVLRVHVSRSHATLAAVVLALSSEHATTLGALESRFARAVNAPGWRDAAREELARRFGAFWKSRVSQVRSHDHLHRWFAYEAEQLPRDVAVRFPHGVGLESVPADSVTVKMHVTVSDFARLCGVERTDDVPVPRDVHLLAADRSRPVLASYEGAGPDGVSRVRVVSRAAVHDPPLWEDASLPDAHSAGGVACPATASLVPRDRRFPAAHQLASLRTLADALRRENPSASHLWRDVVALV